MATKKLNEVTQVTSVTTNHRVVLTDNNGNVSRITPANLYGGMLGGKPANALEQGVFIVGASKPNKGAWRYFHPSEWDALADKSDYLPIGVAVPQDGYLLMVALDEQQMQWATDNASTGGHTYAYVWQALGAKDGKTYTTDTAAVSACVAAQYCAGYSKTALNSSSQTVGAEDGWYLPTVLDVLTIKMNAAKIGYALSVVEGAMPLTLTGSTTNYWTCLDKGGSNAWTVELKTGTVTSAQKNNASLRVRPVFKFC